MAFYSILNGNSSSIELDEFPFYLMAAWGFNSMYQLTDKGSLQDSLDTH
jgi:hypothetical protein